MVDAGQWAQQVTHPSAGITREYVATLDTAPTRKQLQTIAEGACLHRCIAMLCETGAHAVRWVRSSSTTSALGLSSRWLHRYGDRLC